MTHMFAGIAASTDVKTVDDHVFDSYEACWQFTTEHNRDFDGYGEAEWKIASNVRLRSYEGADARYFAIVLYDTEIVRYYPDETFSVDNGGHNTLTSSRRINQFTPSRYWFHHCRKKLVSVFAASWMGEPDFRDHGWPKIVCTHDRRFPVIRPDDERNH